MDVDEVVVADPRLAPHGVDELAAIPHHTGPRSQRGEDVELGAGQRDQLTVQEDLAAGDVDRQRAEHPGGLPRCAGPPRRPLRGRRSIAPGSGPTNSPRGLNGLVT